MRDLFLSALRGEKTERPPIWLMRQAGRVLPDYRLLRERFSLQTCFHNPELAAQITLMPLERLPLDAAIVFTDLLVLLEGLSVPVHYRENAAPIVEIIQDPAAWLKTKTQDPLPSQRVFETLQKVRPQLTVPLIGFCGAPWTLLCYLLQGGGEGTKAKRFLLENPTVAGSILQLLTDEAVTFCLGQVQAGAQAIQIFDSLAHHVDPELYRVVLFPWVRQIVDRVQAARAPVIVFARGSAGHRRCLATLPCALSIDWADELAWWIKETHQPLQGNLDPQILSVCPAALEPMLCNQQRWANERGGMICNLGHGLLPDTPFVHVQALCERVVEGIWSSR